MKIITAPQETGPVSGPGGQRYNGRSHETWYVTYSVEL